VEILVNGGLKNEKEFAYSTKSSAAKFAHPGKNYLCAFLRKSLINLTLICAVLQCVKAF